MVFKNFWYAFMHVKYIQKKNNVKVKKYINVIPIVSAYNLFILYPETSSKKISVEKIEALLKLCNIITLISTVKLDEDKNC